ncbi:MAG: right-handed parallel beta-helix repeat-containing protein [Candidatus Micrarchaeota archaeon]
MRFPLFLLAAFMLCASAAPPSVTLVAPPDRSANFGEEVGVACSASSSPDLESMTLYYAFTPEMLAEDMLQSGQMVPEEPCRLNIYPSCVRHARGPCYPRNCDCSVFGTFGFDSGTYDVDVYYIDENDDGETGDRYQLRVNGQTVGSFSSTPQGGASDVGAVSTFPGISLSTGDEVRLWCEQGAVASYCRAYKLVFRRDEYWHPVDSVPLSGAQDSAAFPLAGLAHGGYEWNCLASNIGGEESFAPANYTFSMQPEQPTPTPTPEPVNAVTPGAFIQGDPTLRSAGFRWIVQGDDDNDATVQVSYRKASDPEWRNAQDMLRVKGERSGYYLEYNAGNLFAGSLLDLEPGTAYEARFVLSDPDGVVGQEVQSAVFATRSEPPWMAEASVRHVYSAEQLVPAAQAAQPGDVILLHEGLYLFPNGINLAGALEGKQTSPEAPIVFRGVDRDAVILDGLASPSGPELNFTDLRGVSNIYLENFTIRNAWTAIRGDDADGLVIRNMNISRVFAGVYGGSYLTSVDRNWLVVDNVVRGWHEQWYPYDTQLASSLAGINVYGRGMVVAFNNVSGFWDAVGVPDTVGADCSVDRNDPPCLDIDFHNNELMDSMDDGIVTDGCYHNVRVFENRVTNAHSGISAQPFYGGPDYIFRNVIYNIATDNPLKLHNSPAGIDAFHNTMASHLGAWQIDAGWQNARIYNNLFMGDPALAGFSLDTGTAPHPRTRFDYNALTPNNYANLIRWNSGGGWTNYPDLAAFFLATGHEQHGFTADYSVFQGAHLPGGEGYTYLPGTADFRLVPSGAAVDAGIVLSGVNDGFAGAAPDLGAYELGSDLPQYGIRNLPSTPLPTPTPTVTATPTPTPTSTPRPPSGGGSPLLRSVVKPATVRVDGESSGLFSLAQQAKNRFDSEVGELGNLDSEAASSISAEAADAENLLESGDALAAYEAYDYLNGKARAAREDLSLRRTVAMASGVVLFSVLASVFLKRRRRMRAQSRHSRAGRG